MGGHITLTTRKNGVVKSIDTMTGYLGYLRTLPFLNEDPNVRLHQILKDDPGSILAPLEYGLCIVDFDQKWIGSLQDYTDLSSWHSLSLRLSHAGNIKADDPLLIPHLQLESAWEQGAIHRLDWYNGKTQKQTQNKIKLKDFNQSEPFFKQIEKDLDFFSNENGPKARTLINQVCFEPKGWTIQRFDHNAEGLIHFLRTLLEKDFPLQLDGYGWQDFMMECYFEKPDPEILIPNLQETIAEFYREKLDRDIPTTPSLSKRSML